MIAVKVEARRTVAPGRPAEQDPGNAAPTQRECALSARMAVRLNGLKSEGYRPPAPGQEEINLTRGQPP